MSDLAISLVVVAARVSIATVFVTAALPKIADPIAFAGVLANYQTFPYWSWNLLAAIVPMMELVGGTCLVLGIKTRSAAWLLLLLTLGFIVVLLRTIMHDVDVACGCFGTSETAGRVGWPELARDLVLAAAIGIAMVRVPKMPHRPR